MTIEKVIYNETPSIQFQIADTGIGIPPNQLPILFHPFTQKNESQSKKEGSGLGLSIAKTLTQYLDGDIQVESELGKGTTFILTLPFQPSETKLSPTYIDLQSEFPSTKNFFEKTLFGICSTGYFSTILKEYFIKWELNFEELLDPKDSIKYDLVVIDDNLDFLSNSIKVLSTSNSILTLPSKYQIIYFTTLSKLSQTREKIKELGVPDKILILTKPIGPSRLSQAIISLFTPRRSHKSRNSIELKKTIYPLQNEEEEEPNFEELVQREELGYVLIVEDNPINQMIIKKQLERLNIKSIVTPSGEEGLSLFEANKDVIKLIFMDQEIDGPFNGTQTIEKIRQLEKQFKSQDENYQDVYIISMTGKLLESDDLKGECDEYFIKPFPLEKINNSIEKIFFRQCQ